MRKVLLWTSSVALMGAFITGCGTASNSPTNSQTSGTSNQTTILVGTDPTFAPFEQSANGTVSGFDIDLINAIAKAENLKIQEIKPMQFTGLIPALESDQIDVAVAGITIKTSRMKAVNFSNAYYQSGLSILVKKGSSIKSLADLVGKTVAAKKGTTSVDLLQQHNIKNVKQYDQTSDMYNALESNSVDAVVFDNPSNLVFATSHSNTEIVGGLLTGEYYGIAITNKKPELQTKINDGLKKIQDDGEYKQIFQKYFGNTTNGMVTTVKSPADVAVNN